MFSEQQLDFQKELDKAGPHRRAKKPLLSELKMMDEDRESIDPLEEDIELDFKKQQADKIVKEQLKKISKSDQSKTSYSDRVYPDHPYDKEEAREFLDNFRRPRQ